MNSHSLDNPINSQPPRIILANFISDTKTSKKLRAVFGCVFFGLVRRVTSRLHFVYPYLSQLE
ncbi:hypothetical protein HZS_5487 [Henneguya salminicola]|nr:hypothetical protein HZS_5487 [Henneguya salminicola]